MKQNATQTEITLCQKLRRVRDHLGVSRPVFAEMLGIPPTTLKNYEMAYRVSVPASLIIKIANHPYLSYLINYLIDESVPVERLPDPGEASE